MNKIKLGLLTLMVSFSTFYTRADEGMWLPFLLGRNYEDMKKHGLNLLGQKMMQFQSLGLKMMKVN